MSFYIPKRLRDKFIAHMDAHNFDEMPDGAWFATLETAAIEFLQRHKLRGDENDATHWYLNEIEKEK